jgi:hypothetical protein
VSTPATKKLSFNLTSTTLDVVLQGVELLGQARLAAAGKQLNSACTSMGSTQITYANELDPH